MNLLSRLEKNKNVWFLLITLFGFFILRLPSLFEPYWYGDEGIYEVIGLALRHGRLLYQGIWDNKPPLLYWTYALFSGNQESVRVLSLLVGLCAVIVFFFLAHKLFTQQKTTFLTTGIFAFLLGSPLLEGNIANSENFMVLPTLIAALLLIYALQTNLTRQRKFLASNYLLLITGLLLGISFLFKVVAIFDVGAFGLFIVFIVLKDRKTLLKTIFELITLGLGFVIPILLTVVYFALHGTLGEFIQATFKSNIGYVNYGNQFLIPQGLLIFKLILLGVFCLGIFIKRNKFPASYLFILLWFAFSLFNAFFSQRPYTHYLLVLIASLSLLIGIVAIEKKIQKKLIVGLLVLLLVLLTNFWIYGKTIFYYGNFLTFVTGLKSVTAYRTFFDSATNRDYDIATFFLLHRKPGDTLFTWGDDGQLYKLINQLPPGRFIVAYHMTMTPTHLKETQQALSQHPPKFIVILPNKPPLPYSLSSYSEIIIIEGATIYERNY